MKSARHFFGYPQPPAKKCLALFPLCSLIATGCVYRSLTIRTEPPGALVYVNDALEGESPVTYDFTWYGWYRVMLRKDGYQRVDDRRELRAPIYLWIPFDLAMEFVPFPIRDDRTWTYTLTPATALPTPKPPPRVAPAPPRASDVPTDSQAADVANAAEIQDTAAASPGPSTTEPGDEPR